MNPVEHVGKRYNRLVVVNAFKLGRVPWFLTLCDCNTFKVIRAHAVVSGHTRSCGCLAHGGGHAAWAAFNRSRAS